MTMQLHEPVARKITVSVPQDLLNRLDHVISSRQRSNFIVEAIEERLALLEQVAVIEESAGSWRDEDYPALKKDNDIDNWLSDLRRGWDRE